MVSKSSAEVIRWCSSSSSSPSRRDSATRSATSSRVKEDEISSFGSRPVSLTTALEKWFSARMIGPIAFAIAISGGASTSAVCSGPAMAMFFGTISPSATCAETTSSSAMTSDTGCSHASGTPRAWNTGSSSAATAGSPRAPSSTPHSVMPSCAQAIISETFSIALSVARARELVTAIGSMTVRRAAISENSAATKNALAASNSTTRPSSSHSLVIASAPSAARRRPRRRRDVGLTADSTTESIRRRSR